MLSLILSTIIKWYENNGIHTYHHAFEMACSYEEPYSQLFSLFMVARRAQQLPMTDPVKGYVIWKLKGDIMELLGVGIVDRVGDIGGSWEVPDL